MKKKADTRLNLATFAGILAENFLGPILCWENTDIDDKPQPAGKVTMQKFSRHGYFELADRLETAEKGIDSAREDVESVKINDDSYNDLNVVSLENSKEEKIQKFRVTPEGLKSQDGRIVHLTRAMIKDSHAEQKVLRRELENVKKQIYLLRSENKNWKELYERFKKSSTSQQERNAKLKFENKLLLHQEVLLEEELKMERQHVESLKKENELMKTQNAPMRKENVLMKTQNESMKKENVLMKTQNESMKEENKYFQEERSRYLSRIEVLQEERKKTIMQLDTSLF
jgi:hypothetical protein